MKYFKLLSTVDDVLEFTSDGESEFLAAAGCKVCWWPSARWRRHPWPVDVAIKRAPRGPIARVVVFPTVLRADLAELLRPYLPEALWGSVHVERPHRSEPAGSWLTCVPDRNINLYSDRGTYCRHVICVGGCGGVGNLIGWASGAIVRRDIGGRLCFFDHDCSIFIADELIEKLQLRRRFPDLLFYEYDVVEEPLDGEILPGDPGWDGVFRPRPRPRVPNLRPKPGRWTVP
jgi:hypothetical protein